MSVAAECALLTRPPAILSYPIRPIPMWPQQAQGFLFTRWIKLKDKLLYQVQVCVYGLEHIQLNTKWIPEPDLLLDQREQV